MPYIPDTHPLPLEEPGSVRLKLDVLVSVQESMAGGRSQTLRLPAQVVFTRLANRLAPGLFGEPEIRAYAPGYTVEDFGRAKVVWPVRDQEAFDPVVRFIPGDPAAQVLFGRIEHALAAAGALAAPRLEAPSPNEAPGDHGQGPVR
jgi:hypothetical protein